MTYTGEMVLPRNAVVMREEEMRYVEGGYTISASTCKKITKVLKKVSGYSAIFAAVAGYTGNAIAALVTGLVGIGAGYLCDVFTKAGKHHGFRISITNFGIIY